MKAIKHKGIVGKKGKIEIESAELTEGTEVEIIILVPFLETDTTDYLLSTDANRRELSEAIQRVEKQQDLVKFTPEEWHEKHSF